MAVRSKILLGIEQYYHGKGKVSLRSIAEEREVQLTFSKGPVVVAAVGDAGAGKSGFLNALAEELVLSTSSKEAVQWVVGEEVKHGHWPGLLARAVEKFPSWEPRATAAVKACKRVPGSRLDGIQLVEVRAPTQLEDQEVIDWLLAHVDIVVCLLDSQAKPSDELMALLSRTAAAEAAAQLHFLFAKADLVPRESDRIRLIAKTSRALQEGLGRGFEILPVATGDLNVMLDIIDEAVLADAPTPKWDGGRLRTWRLAQDLLSQRVQRGLEDLQSDCQALRTALRSTDAPRAASHLFACGNAFALATAAVPYVLDENEDPALVKTFMVLTMACAGICLFLAFLSCRVNKPAAAEGEVKEQEDFLSLVEQQCEAWRSLDNGNGEEQGAVRREAAREERTE
ncbi:unnamed protein product [Effrenium voratum]|nr:unnamed protein product [Effrenium voratum]